MKVLLTATVQSHICQFHRPLVEMLHEQGAIVHVAAKDNLSEKNGLKLDFVEKVYNIPFERSPKSLKNVLAYRKLKTIIDRENYDVIHCNTPIGGVITRIAAKNARKNGTKVYYTAHGFHFYKGAPIKNWMLYYPIERIFANRYTDKLITINEEDFNLANATFNCEVVRTHGVGVEESCFKIIDVNEKQIKKQIMGYGERYPIILCVGELLPNKNHQLAIRAMNHIAKRYEKALLIIAGNGKEHDKLKSLVKELGIENNVNFLGYTININDYLSVSDVLISCSKREGLPFNVVEAMLSGIPVVVSNIRGHRDLIENDVNGYIFTKNDEQLIAELVITIFENNIIIDKFKNNALLKGKEYCSTNTKIELSMVYGT